jgi:A/G-specific adenine glycosylase
VTKQHSKVSEAGQIWLSIEDAIGAAIPTPVRKILQSLLDPKPLTGNS